MRGFLCMIVSALSACFAPAQTAFTYQGELTVDGAPAQGLHDLRFRLYDFVGTQVGSTLCAGNVPAAGGGQTGSDNPDEPDQIQP